MHDHTIDPRDEGRHAPGDDRFWSESYYLDFHRDDGSLGGYVRISFYPMLGVSWYWACVVGPDRPLVLVVEHGAPALAQGLDLSHGRLKTTHSASVPTKRFDLTLDAEARVFADPADVYRDAVGEPVPLRFDLRWDTDGPGGYRFRDLTRYEIPCRVGGTIEVGDELIEFVGHGQRDHSWGPRDWWTNAWCWNAGRLEDGTRFHAVAPRTLEGQEVPWAAGYVQPPGAPLEPIRTSSAREELDPEGLPTRGRIEVGELALDVEPIAFAPVLLVDPEGRISRFPRAMARYRAPDGRTGLGWIEWNQPRT